MSLRDLFKNILPKHEKEEATQEQAKEYLASFLFLHQLDRRLYHVFNILAYEPHCLTVSLENETKKVDLYMHSKLNRELARFAIQNKLESLVGVTIRLVSRPSSANIRGHAWEFEFFLPKAPETKA